MKRRKPLQIFIAVQKALFLRELNMRFSKSKTGIFWTFIEPFMQVMAMVIIKVFLFSSDNNSFNFETFLALNFIAYNMFKNIITQSMGAFTANKGLFVYKQVKPIDTIIARTLVEIYFTGIVICIFLALGLYLEYDLSIKNLPMVTLGFLFLLFFAISSAILIATINTYFSSLGKIINISMTFLMFGSAIFYTIESLPKEIQTLLVLNPLTHFMEMIHGYYFFTLDDSFVNYNYIMLWSISSLFIVLWFYRYLEERIISL